jgi:hypothetical protein
LLVGLTPGLCVGQQVRTRSGQFRPTYVVSRAFGRRLCPG